MNTRMGMAVVMGIQLLLFPQSQGIAREQVLDTGFLEGGYPECVEGFSAG